MELLRHATFWALAALTVAAAVYVALAPHILRAAFALAATFLGVAGLFLFLGADFLAAVQFFIYVGGIVVLLVFAVMFTPNLARQRFRESAWNLPLALVALAGIGVLVGLGLRWVTAASPAEGLGFAPTADGLAALLVGKYLVAFELAGVLLLAVMVGALVLVRKEVRPEEPEAGER